MISVVILTLNEEQDLPRCLESLSWSTDVHVLDSGSTDQTIEIARSYGAKVWNKVFTSFGEQRNFALEKIPFAHDWVLFLDADEEVTSAFEQAIKKSVLEAKEETAGFYCCWKMMLEDKWLKHCDNFPKWQFRLLKTGRASFTDFGHGQKEGEVSGKLEFIKEPYLHHGFSKGWTQWMERHNRYSSLEARDRIEKLPAFKNVFSKNTSKRNPALKSWLSRIPGWPLLRFCQAYILNLGFTEGVPGFIYCTNMAYHEFLIQIKMREIIRKEKGLPRLPETSKGLKPEW